MPEVAQFEPYPALYGGSDGLEFYRLAAETAEHSKPGAILAVEHAMIREQPSKKYLPTHRLLGT